MHSKTDTADARGIVHITAGSGSPTMKSRLRISHTLEPLHDSLSRPGAHGNGLHLAGGPTSCNLFCSAGGGFWPFTSFAAVQQSICYCEGYRMPAPHEPFHAHGGRRPITSKGGNRGCGTYGGAAGFDLSGLDGCRRRPAAQLFRHGTNVANGRKQLLHHV
jgi:hypothetical protein